MYPRYKEKRTPSVFIEIIISTLLHIISTLILQPRERGRMRFHAIQNVETALRFLRYKEIKLVNIRGEDIVDGNPKLTLGLIWTIILHFQVGKFILVAVRLSGILKAKQKLDVTFNFDTLDSGINIGVRLLIFGLFSRGYILIREGNAYFFSI